MVFVAKGKVSVPWQMLFAVIPIADLLGFLRIQKLSRFLLYVYAPALATSVAKGFLFPITEGDVFNAADELLLLADIMIGIGFAIWSVLLMYFWARQWNDRSPKIL